MKIPTLPTNTKPFIWGAIAGAVAMTITGFSWGGWVTSSTAEGMASTRADAAVVSALTPICVAQFQNSAGAAANLVALKEIKSSWDQRTYVSDGGWATMPGSSDEPDRNLATACADALSELTL